LKSLMKELAGQLTAREWKLATAESCTGGGVAYQLTETAGSSAWFERGFVTYSNLAKVEMLGVKQSTLESFGAVSEQVVRAMAEGALSHSQAQVSIAITGIAGPEGGSKEKPVGSVWFGWAGVGRQCYSCF
jgi:nicotinamide-nucleotide amidase